MVARGRGFIEQNDRTVVLPLIKDLRDDQSALARGDAPGDVDFYVHAVVPSIVRYPVFEVAHLLLPSRW
jgi:hypothetical protein